MKKRKTERIVSFIVAAALVFVLSGAAVPAFAGTWYQNDKGWWYLNDDNTYPAGAWLYDNGEWYLFDEEGYMITGWALYGGCRYFFNEDGSMATGRVIEDGIMYFMDESGAWTGNSIYVGDGGNGKPANPAGLHGAAPKPEPDPEPDPEPEPEPQANSIVSVEKTATNGLVDTYTITFTDGSTSTFDVTNGKDGEDGKDGTDGKDGAPGENGKDGESIVGPQGPEGPAGTPPEIAEVEIQSGGDLIITYTDGTKVVIPYKATAVLTVYGCILDGESEIVIEDSVTGGGTYEQGEVIKLTAQDIDYNGKRYYVDRWEIVEGEAYCNFDPEQSGSCDAILRTDAKIRAVYRPYFILTSYAWNKTAGAKIEDYNPGAGYYKEGELAEITAPMSIERNGVKYVLDDWEYPDEIWENNCVYQWEYFQNLDAQVMKVYIFNDYTIYPIYIESQQ